MRMIFAAAALFGALSTAAAASAAVKLPADGDDYSKLVARADAQDQSLDFHALRLAYLKSAQRKRAGDEDALQKSLFDAVKAGDDAGVRSAAEKLLSVDYIDMYGQKFLRQSCVLLKDDACAQKAHFVEFGLLQSITTSGDGKTCKTGWDVVMVKEEYFVLAMLNTRVKMQSLAGGCDVMSVVDSEGKEATYFFRIGAVLEDEQSMFR